MDRNKTLERPDWEKVHKEYEEIIEQVLAWDENDIAKNILQESDLLKLKKIKAACEWKMHKLHSSNPIRIGLGKFMPAISGKIREIEEMKGGRRLTEGYLRGFRKK